MQDDEAKRGFDEIKALIADLGKQIHARVGDVEASFDARFRILEGKVDANTRGLTNLESRFTRTETLATNTADVATGAVRKASDSLVAIEGIADGLKAHLAALEATREREAADAKRARDAVEAARNEAARKHAARFDEQGNAINALLKAQRAGNSWRWLAPVLVTLATIIGNQVVEVVKATHDPTQSQEHR